MVQDAIVFGFLLVAILAAGLAGRLRGGTVAERFVAKRQLSWLTLGASMAAAQISADTPLLVAGAVYADGLAGNWFWWISAPGVLATLFFFAPLWRRSGVLTDVEIIKLRYGDTGLARAFRIFKAIADGFIVNALVLASNLYAFTLLLQAVFKQQPGLVGIDLATLVSTAFLAVAVLFVGLAGFRGLVRANTLEFILAILSSGVLAAFAVSGLPHGLESLKGLTTYHGHASPLNVLPTEGTLSVIILLGLGWWHSAPGHTMLVQRMVASRDEREAGLTVMSFSIFHYLLRPWGWYLIGAAALYYWPHLGQSEQALPTAARALLPSSLFGLIAASVALSFLGCVNSRLNLGATYLVNDVAKVILPSLSAMGARIVEIVATLTLALFVFAIASGHLLSSIRGLYQFLIMMMAGTGFVSIARWYWSGTTIKSEMASYASAVIVAGLTLAFTNIQKLPDFAIMSGVNFLIGGAMTVAVAKLWPQRDLDATEAFYRNVQPQGAGWNGYHTGASAGLGRMAWKWALSNITLFSAIFLIVNLIAGRFAIAAALTVMAVAAGLVLSRGRKASQTSTVT